MTTLRQFITNKQYKPLWQQEKSVIYRNFLQKRERKNTNRWGIVYKTLTYSISTLSIIGIILFGNISNIFQHKSIELSQSVVAQSIGKIVSSKWIFWIYNKENRKIDTDTIQLSDRVVVDVWSTIKILIRDSFTAEVIGPAQFEIILEEENDNKNYNIKFTNWWNYIAVDSVGESAKNHISVETSDGVTVKRDQKDEFKKISFAIQSNSKDENTKIINKSTSSLNVSTNDVLVLWKTRENTKANITIEPEQVIEITSQWTNNNDIKIISQSNISNDNITVKPVKSINALSTIEPIEKINEDDNNQIKSNLYKTFLQNDYESLVLYYFWGKETQYNIVKNNINDRLNRLAKIGKLSTNSDTSLSWMIFFAQSIQNQYEKLNIPQTTYKNLTPLIKKLNEINKHAFWIIKQWDKKKETTLWDIYSLINLEQNNNMYRFR